MKKREPLKFRLPNEVGVIARAVHELRHFYSNPRLTFTPDGKFVGDVGEAVAAEMFGIRLEQQQGIDGYTSDDVAVQVKTTGRKKGGAVFRDADKDHPKNTQLIVYYIDWEAGEGELLYNGLEKLVRPDCKRGQREASRHRLLTAPLEGSQELPINSEFHNRYIA
jgi:hypothetical protein